MEQETLQHQSPTPNAGRESVVIELTLEDVESVAGGPQITNDSFQPP